MSKYIRTAEHVVTEYRERGRTPDQIRIIAVSANRPDVLEVLRKQKEGLMPKAWVTCKRCNKLVVFGEEYTLNNKAYCALCYPKEKNRGKVQDSEPVADGDGALETGKVSGQLPEVYELDPATQKALESVLSAGSEEEPGVGASGPADGVGETAGTGEDRGDGRTRKGRGRMPI